MNPALKRFNRDYVPMADAVARLHVEQTVREQVATALTEALDGRPDFRPDLFWLLAADPLVPCMGPADGEACPQAHQIRIPMHLDGGRAASWQPHPPEVRCAPCGATYHLRPKETR